MADSTTMCNAGSPPYCKGFLSSLQSIKVSMKKKRREVRETKSGRSEFKDAQRPIQKSSRSTFHVIELEDGTSLIARSYRL